MKIYLQAFKEFYTVLELDTETKKRFVIDRSANGIKTCYGFYFNFDSDIIGIFCFEKKIWLYYNDVFQVYDNTTKVEYSRRNNITYLKFVNSQNSYSLNYEIENPISSLTYTEEDEDADFGLWLANVINSDERRANFFKYNSAKS